MRFLPPPAARPQHARVHLLAVRTVADRSGVPALSAAARAALRRARAPRRTVSGRLLAVWAAAAYQGKVYVVGGYTQSGESSALLRYDPGRNRWSQLRSAPSRRGALAVGVIGHRLYAAGGAHTGRPLRTLEIYNLRTGRWSS